MIRIPIFRATFVILLASGLPAMSALDNRFESLGPLGQYDPYEEAPEFLVKTHGRPDLGLPTGAGNRIQRISDGIWYLGLDQGVARMEPDYKTGEIVLRNVIDVSKGWCVSPDTKMMFAGRPSKKYYAVRECFDLASGKSKWTFEKGQNLMEACFTPDGKRVAILHQASHPQPAVNPGARSEAVVSWYDADSGELVRRVGIPGGSGGTEGSGFLAFAGDRLYLTRPGDDTGGECFVIAPGASEPEKIVVEALGSERTPRVAIGGLHSEFVTFYSNRHVSLYRQESDDSLTFLSELELESNALGNPYNWCARFTPDGNHLVMSNWEKSVFIPTREASAAEIEDFPGGSPLADFSEDGTFFVTFDDGGGRVRNATTWEVVKSFESRLHPPHCCPITEAGFSMSGNFIVSSDGSRLLLWSRQGQQLAELFSPRKDSNDAVRMQSAVIVEDKGKIFAADGFDFLMWDLAALNKRLARKPDNVPRVRGEVVFQDRTRKNTRPDIMNISMDSKGENIVTATQTEVRYRPIATAAPVVVRAPADDMLMIPRSLSSGFTDSSVIISSSGDAFSLDLSGNRGPEPIAQGMIAADTAANRVYSVSQSGGGSSLRIRNREETTGSSELMDLPTGWRLSHNNGILSPDGRWMVVTPHLGDRLGTFAVIDVADRRVVHTQSMNWQITSLSLSQDGNRLLVGSFNRALYEFDFLKMIQAP